ARQEKTTELRLRLAPPDEEGGRAGQEAERGRAEVRDPSGQEDRQVGLGGIAGIIEERISVKIIADVVERHDDHHEAFEEVQGLDPCGCGNGHEAAGWRWMKTSNLPKVNNPYPPSKNQVLVPMTTPARAMINEKRVPSAGERNAYRLRDCSLTGPGTRRRRGNRRRSRMMLPVRRARE